MAPSLPASMDNRDEVLSSPGPGHLASPLPDIEPGPQQMLIQCLLLRLSGTKFLETSSSWRTALALPVEVSPQLRGSLGLQRVPQSRDGRGGGQGPAQHLSAPPPPAVPPDRTLRLLQTAGRAAWASSPSASSCLGPAAAAAAAARGAYQALHSLVPKTLRRHRHPQVPTRCRPSNVWWWEMGRYLGDLPHSPHWGALRP